MRRALSAGVAPRPHVCFVAPTTWPVLSGDQTIRVVGGAELQQTVIATALARRGYRVSMICLDYGQPDGVVVDGVTIHKIHTPDAGLPVLRFVHPRMTKLWQVMKRVDADVYYQRCASVHTGYVAAFCRLNGKKSIYAGASDVDFMPGRQDIAFARDRFIFDQGLKRVDRVLVQNPLQLKLLRESYGIDGVLVPNCFNPPVQQVSDDQGYVLWVATMRPSKRPEVLIEMARRMPGTRFVVVGGPDGEPASEQLARDMRAAAAELPNLDYRGFVPFGPADRLFDGARVLLNTSRYEGFPNTFLQAWARGVPTVSFVDTGSRLDGEPVYSIAKDVEQGCAQLERLLADDAAWRAASQRVRRFFDATHSVDAVAGQYEREIAQLCAAR